jgi:hypothetical protein
MQLVIIIIIRVLGNAKAMLKRKKKTVETPPTPKQKTPLQ